MYILIQEKKKLPAATVILFSQFQSFQLNCTMHNYIAEDKITIFYTKFFAQKQRYKSIFQVKISVYRTLFHGCLYDKTRKFSASCRKYSDVSLDLLFFFKCGKLHNRTVQIIESEIRRHFFLRRAHTCPPPQRRPAVNELFVCLFSIVLCVLSFEATTLIGIGKSTEGCGSCSSGGRRAKHGGF